MNSDLKQLWNDRQQPAAPDAATVIEKARSFRRKNLQRIVFVNVSMVATAVFMGLVCYYWQPVIITKKVGTILAILSVGCYMAAVNQFMPLLKGVSLDLNGREYLQKLISYRKKELMLQKILVNGYYLLLAAGLSLYLIDPSSTMPLGMVILVYAVSLGWVAWSWFYRNPRRIRKQRDEMNEMIDSLTRVGGQFSSGG